MSQAGTLFPVDCRAEHGHSTRVLQTSDFNLFCDLKGVVDLDEKVPHCALNFLVPKKQLRRPEIARAAVNESYLGSSGLPLPDGRPVHGIAVWRRHPHARRRDRSHGACCRSPD